jgi:malate synthase
MEDAATAEISRAQIWQWIRHRAKLEDGRTIDVALCSAILDEELAKLREVAEDGNRYENAAELFRELVEAPTFLRRAIGLPLLGADARAPMFGKKRLQIGDLLPRCAMPCRCSEIA